MQAARGARSCKGDGALAPLHAGGNAEQPGACAGAQQRCPRAAHGVLYDHAAPAHLPCHLHRPHWCLRAPAPLCRSLRPVLVGPPLVVPAHCCSKSVHCASGNHNVQKPMANACASHAKARMAASFEGNVRVPDSVHVRAGGCERKACLSQEALALTS